MKTGKKILSLCLVILMVLLSAPLTGFVDLDWGVKASAKTLIESGTLNDNVAYTFDSSTGLLTISGTGEIFGVDMYAITPFFGNNDIKSVVIEEGITSIGEDIFSGCKSLESVTIPNSVKSIGSYAFSECASLKSVTIPDSVTSIGSFTFEDCTALDSITIGNGVTNIGYSAFHDTAYYNNKDNWEDDVLYISNCLIEAQTSAVSYDVKEGTICIGNYAFDNCASLKSITIPDSVISIGNYVFDEYGSLEHITVDEDNKFYSSDSNGVLFNKDKTELLQYPISSTQTSYEIPGSVTSIDDYAFGHCTLESVTIPNSVTSIGDYAFQYCKSLVSVTIPKSVTSIGEHAFYSCESVKSIAIPDGVKSIEKYTFYDCKSLENVTIGNSVTIIGELAFNNCTSLKSVAIPDSVTIIGDLAFYCCTSLESVTIPKNVTYIGQRVFYDCKALNNITVDKNNKCYSNDSSGVLFDKDKTELVQYPIGNKQTSYEIPSSVTSIDEHAFSSPNSLTELHISDLDTWCSISFISERSNPLHYAKKLYLNDELVTDLIVPDGVKSIGSYAFDSCTSIKSVTIPDSVTSIGESAFNECKSLENVTIGNGVKSIDSFAFYLCTSLDSVTIPSSVNSIGSYAFDETGYYNDENNWENGVLYIGKYLIKANSSIASCDIKDGTLSIAGNAFCECTSLDNVTIPDSVTSLGGFSFYNCTGLTNITIPNGVTSIGDSTFSGCTNLTDVTIPNGVTSIGDYAFCKCSSLKSVTIPNSVTNISWGAFKNCTSLENITLPDAAIDIGETAFENTAYYNNKNNWENGVFYIGKHLIDVNETIDSCDIKDGTLSIADGAFEYCYKLENIAFPDSVKIIGAESFVDCYSLETIKIGSNVENIGYMAFVCCTSLKSITVDPRNKYYSSDKDGVLFNKDKTQLIQYPLGNKQTSYKIPDGVMSFAEYAFAASPYLKSVTISDSVTSIGKNAFLGCLFLEKVIMPDSVTNIDYAAFYKIISITDVYYTGSKDNWDSINIDSCNEPLIYATIHYNYVITDNTAEDSTTGVKITYTNDNLNEDFDLVVSENPVNANFVFGSYESFKAYNITLEAKGEKVQPNGKVTVSLPMPTGYNQDSTVVYYVDENKEKTLIDSEIKNGYIIFETDHFSEYVIVDLSTKKEQHIHNYSTAVTDPTCTEKGYTTYTCTNCGNSYTANEVAALGHSLSPFTTTKAPSCTEKGTSTANCLRCDYVETKDIAATGHNYQDGRCTACGEAKSCSCNCHKTGFMGFIWKIQCFFYKIFKTNKTCSCGVAHY